jgi:hypothetical protein
MKRDFVCLYYHAMLKGNEAEWMLSQLTTFATFTSQRTNPMTDKTIKVWVVLRGGTTTCGPVVNTDKTIVIYQIEEQWGKPWVDCEKDGWTVRPATLTIPHSR